MEYIAECLLKTVEKPVKEELSKLSAAELRKIGVTVVETGDAVVIRAIDSDIDKLVTALLRDDELKEDAA